MARGCATEIIDRARNTKKTPDLASWGRAGNPEFMF